MPNEDRQPVDGDFPAYWGIKPEEEEEVKKQIRGFLSGSKHMFAGELEDRTNDLLQETRRRFIRRLMEKEAAPICKPVAYIKKIAKHVCLEFIAARKKKLENEVRLSLPRTEESEDTSTIESIYDERDQPEQILLSQEELDRIFSLIGQLPQPLQDVIRLQAEGIQLREIARRTSMSFTDVRGHLQEGREQLRQLLHQ